MLKALKYYGGKLSQLDYILPMIPKHDCYVEPFGGSAAVMLNKHKSNVEVYNDLDSRVVTFFRVLRDHPKELKEYLSRIPYSREEFEFSKQVITDFQRTELEQAAMFYFMSECSINCNLSQFSYSRSKNRTKQLINSINNLPKVADRIREWVIEHEDAINCIHRYDRAETFFYLDPPYMQGARSKQRYNIDYDDYSQLSLLLEVKRIKGKVLLSGYNNELYNNHLINWNKKEYSVNCKAIFGRNVDTRTEVLWYNYEIERRLF